MKHLKSYNESKKAVKYIPIDIVNEAIDISLDLEDDGVNYSLQLYVYMPNVVGTGQWFDYENLCEFANKDEIIKTTQSIGINIIPEHRDKKYPTVSRDIIKQSVTRFVSFAEESGLSFNIHLSPSYGTTSGRREFTELDAYFYGTLEMTAKIEICIFPTK